MLKLTTNLSIKELTNMYKTGEIAIPEIQRDFVWDAKRIRLLLDSIQKDYPSGAVILWRPEFKERSEFEMLFDPNGCIFTKNVCLPIYYWMGSRDLLHSVPSYYPPNK